MKELISIYVSLFLVFSILFNSCTFIGLGIGVTKDLRRPNHEYLQLEDFTELKRKSKITVILNNGSIIQGKFYGIYSESVDGLEANEYLLIRITVLRFHRYETDSISVDNIVAIEKKNSNYSWLRWGLIGYALDIFFFEVILGGEDLFGAPN